MMNWLKRKLNLLPGNCLRGDAYNVFSQNGEDGIIGKIFEIIPAKNKCCVEFGAADGKIFSNTRNLIVTQRWSGVLIESDENSYTELSKNYKHNQNVVCFNKKVDFEGENTLDKILEQTDLPKEFDFLSIDIDGNDYHIWKSFKAYKPAVVIIEFNPTIPNDIEFIQPRDMNISQGSSLLSTIKLGKAKSYEAIAVTNWNVIFVRKELYTKFGLKSNSINELGLSNDWAYTRLFQLYDGSLVLNGCKRHIWKDSEFLPDELAKTKL